MDAFVRRVRAQVPFFKAWPEVPFDELPTTSRADLARDVAAFVPDDLPVDRLLRFDTTGTTGHRIAIPSHPTVAARHLAFLRKALAWRGIELRAGTDSAGNDLLLLVGAEPDHAWRQFIEAVLELAELFDVRMLVGLGAYPATVPHTRPVTMSVTAATEELAAVS